MEDDMDVSPAVLKFHEWWLLANIEEVRIYKIMQFAGYGEAKG